MNIYIYLELSVFVCVSWTEWKTAQWFFYRSRKRFGANSWRINRLIDFSLLAEVKSWSKKRCNSNLQMIDTIVSYHNNIYYLILCVYFVIYIFWENAINTLKFNNCFFLFRYLYSIYLNLCYFFNVCTLGKLSIILLSFSIFCDQICFLVLFVREIGNEY